MAYEPYSKTNQYIIDGAVVGIAFYLAYQIRFEGAVPATNALQLWLLLPIVIAGRLATSALLGTYRWMWRYVSLLDAIHIARTYAVFSGFLLVLRLGLPGQWALFRVPLSIITIEFLLSLVGALSVRSLRRITYDRQDHFKLTSGEKRRVLLVGAGAAGVMAAKELLALPERKLVGFLDDNPKKIGAIIGGIPVLGPLHELAQVVKDQGVDEVVLCIARAPRDVLKRIWRLCDGLDVQTSLIPTLNEIINGEVRVSHLREFSMEDLLDRETVDRFFHEPEVLRFYRGKRILITGAGGSIGSELARQFASLEPDRLLLMDKDENGLHDLQLQFAARVPAPRYELLLGDVRSVERVRNIFEKWRPEIVFHAAAHKHVPLMEVNAAEAVLNNVFGTRNLIAQVNEHETALFVLISTDKAVKPSSVMGASKRLAELLVQCKRNHPQTRFACVRFGNVMNSRGSVIPLFQRQIAAGGPVTLTDPDAYRYFMTIPEAVQLVIQVGLLADGNGRIYVLDMGDPVRLASLVRDLIQLHGLRPDRDVRIEIIGLRLGEKLREELVGGDEYLTPTECPKIFAADSAAQPETDKLERLLDNLRDAALRDNVGEIYRLFKEFNFGFQQT
ncbi:polysaccharide biosynthesis protein [Acidobacteriia bacterium AH_259_A11_L15]|nr:polysaccharide biosynthesis protein [Acidobacteriia bacterium AH_259_A11_L15]